MQAHNVATYVTRKKKKLINIELIIMVINILWLESEVYFQVPFDMHCCDNEFCFLLDGQEYLC